MFISPLSVLFHFTSLSYHVKRGSDICTLRVYVLCIPTFPNRTQIQLLGAFLAINNVHGSKLSLQ